jgi:hypothetical protein
MSEDTLENNKLNATQLINANTVVVLNLKNLLMGILTLGGTLLSIFFGFYLLVVVPKIEDTEEHYKTMFEQQANENKSIRTELNNLNTGISTLTGTINAINRNNPASTNTTINRSGGVGDNSIGSSTDEERNNLQGNNR